MVGPLTAIDIWRMSVLVPNVASLSVAMEVVMLVAMEGKY